MPRTEEKVESLLREDSEMEELVDVLLERTDYGNEEVQWSDVEDDMSTGQWGRLIQSGLLVEQGDGFTVADPEGVVEALESDDGAPEEVSWTRWDKAAGIVALNMMIAYTLTSVRDAFAGVLNVVLGPLDALLPFWGVISLLALLSGVVSIVLQERLQDKQKLAYYKQQMEELQDMAGDADPEELEELTGDVSLLSIQKNMLKAQFRPMVWVMLLTIPVFLWLLWKTQTGQIATGEESVMVPMIGRIVWSQPIIGPFESWMVWYFVCSLVITQLVRKALGISMIPDPE